MKIGIITNPHSRKNQKKKGDRLATLTRLVGDEGLVRQTETVDEVRAVMEEFVDRGVRFWVSDGGDGTFHWMLNHGREVLERRHGHQDHLPRLVPTNGGTIDFVARKAGIKGQADGIVRQLVGKLRHRQPPSIVDMDTVEVLGWTPDDPADRPSFRKIGFAVAAGGTGQSFFAKYYAEPQQGVVGIFRVIAKAMAGVLGDTFPLRFLPIVPEHLRVFSRDLLAGTRAVVEADGRRVPAPAVLQGLHVGSIDVVIGGVRMFHYASERGKLHGVAGAVSPLKAAYQWIYYFLGKELPGDQWHEFPAERIVIESCGDLLDPVIDGELFYGYRRLELSLGPRVGVPVITG